MKATRRRTLLRAAARKAGGPLLVAEFGGSQPAQLINLGESGPYLPGPPIVTRARVRAEKAGKVAGVLPADDTGAEP